LNIIDIHTHAFADDIAPKAIEALQKSSGTKALLDGTTSDLLRSMKRARIDLSVIQPVATKPSQVRAINVWASQIVGDGLLPFGTLYPGQPDWEDEIVRIKRAGLSGIKFHPDYQSFDPDDRDLFPIYEKLQAESLVVLYHAGDDISFPPPGRGTPKSLLKIVEHFPALNVIAAHLGGFKMWDEVEAYLAGKDIYLDMSYTFGYMETERIIRIMERHGFDRILFGTDSPWKDQQEEVQNILRLDIPDEAKSKILAENAHKLLDL